jgi:hydrogenase maturation protease
MMSGQLTPSRGKTLVIGYGNTLRSDDGVGQHVALAVASWGLPGLETIVVHQLAPELAEPLALAELAIFVDAHQAEIGAAVKVSLLEAANSVRAVAHASDPRWLLALAEAAYGRRPRAWLVKVPAVDFSLREGLSTTAKSGAEQALERIAALVS